MQLLNHKLTCLRIYQSFILLLRCGSKGELKEIESCGVGGEARGRVKKVLIFAKSSPDIAKKL